MCNSIFNDSSLNSCGHTTGFYPGKIVLPGKNFPGLTSKIIKFQLASSKHLGAKMENMFEKQTDQRKVFILISLLFITLFQRARRARVILLQRLISRGIQRRRGAAFWQFLTIKTGFVTRWVHLKNI